MTQRAKGLGIATHQCSGTVQVVNRFVLRQVPERWKLDGVPRKPLYWWEKEPAGLKGKEGDMAQLSTAELQRMARETFGRELSAEQAEAFRSRLPFLVEAIHLLQEWEDRLQESEPAAVHRTPTERGEEYDAT
ncbi:MAG: hypothetical protein D6736_21150 [Nitrospinota bacterium]|nr:MAG: hypothetical protein D6736_21150 [Nitrospinota bacterium]